MLVQLLVAQVAYYHKFQLQPALKWEFMEIGNVLIVQQDIIMENSFQARVSVKHTAHKY